MNAYYNEIDPFCCEWLRNLIAAGYIAPGDVDERDIRAVQPDDLRGYAQCHFFAGIGGWSLGLRIAGWPDSKQIYTGSPPCQDNSLAAAIYGHRKGTDGPRSGLVHPWLALIKRSGPRAVGFENVPGIEPWLDYITESMEGFGLRVSKSKLASSDIGAPHLRRRVWVFADRSGPRSPLTRQPQSSAVFTDPRASAPGDYWASTQRGFRPLDDGLPSRMAGVHAFGNAVDPHTVARFVGSMMECCP